MTAQASHVEAPLPVDDPAQTILNAHDGDALAALRHVIADAEFLHDQLAIASTILSHGIGRGWQPRFQR
ncbi:hypothetical protein [Neorhizobium galegae]|uniref:hypothetical protein n=1 Tax=Neorhizobium galegae TaxID=399 RepID=UPI000622A7BB|nr:hypothetical protein [Neorhizobium galegae]KAB1120002.1 hypothetical protein F4V90_31060 [Neorhizobium galegae]MCQ1810657.1 hypothetical protein [Neorhizobium galegae]CDZ64792.1 Hypothetical protein NGAL_HAMBI2566_62150 [Neorhizobium galegae bv. orientalis]